jgi:hypothetical protein
VSGDLEIVAADGTRSILAISRGTHVLTRLGVQVVPVDGGVRIEPTTAGALLHLDGEELFCKQLCAGEFVVLDSVRLRLFGATGTATSRERSAAAPAPAAKSSATPSHVPSSQPQLAS